jgi:hypothetical protein
VLTADGQLVIVDGGRLEGWYGRLIDALYRLVWLRQHTNALPTVIRFGDFHLQVQRVSVGNSSVLVMIGKPYAAESEH